MKSYKVSLKETYGLEGGELECMLSESPFDVPSPEWRRPAVVVVPGGGYCMVSKREGEPWRITFSPKDFRPSFSPIAPVRRAPVIPNNSSNWRRQWIT